MYRVFVKNTSTALKSLVISSEQNIILKKETREYLNIIMLLKIVL